MSDEIHIESAFLRSDLSARQQWHGLSPDEYLMEKEEEESLDKMEEQREERWRVISEMQQAFLVYCFADTSPEEWETVAARAYVVISFLLNSTFGDRSMDEIRNYRLKARPVSGYPAREIVEMLWPERDAFAKVMAYYFPEGREWLKHGTQNLYLIARNYQPGVVTLWDGRELTYERLAVVFGELPEVGAQSDVPVGWMKEDWTKARERARSRWSARAQQLIVRPIERMSGSAPALFGKGAEVRRKYQAAAMGNQNRRIKH